jgi:hypothetical protein
VKQARVSHRSGRQSHSALIFEGNWLSLQLLCSTAGARGPTPPCPEASTSKCMHACQAGINASRHTHLLPPASPPFKPLFHVGPQCGCSAKSQPGRGTPANQASPACGAHHSVTLWQVPSSRDAQWFNQCCMSGALDMVMRAQYACQGPPGMYALLRAHQHSMPGTPRPRGGRGGEGLFVDTRRAWVHACSL